MADATKSGGAETGGNESSAQAEADRFHAARFRSLGLLAACGVAGWVSALPAVDADMAVGVAILGCGGLGSFLVHAKAYSRLSRELGEALAAEFLATGSLPDRGVLGLGAGVLWVLGWSVVLTPRSHRATNVEDLLRTVSDALASVSS